MTRQLTALAVSLALLAAGCGGDDDEEKAKERRGRPAPSVLSTTLVPSPTQSSTQIKK